MDISQAFALLMDISQAAVFFYLSFQFVILHLIVSIYTKFHHLLFGPPLGWNTEYPKMNIPTKKWNNCTGNWNNAVVLSGIQALDV